MGTLVNEVATSTNIDVSEIHVKAEIPSIEIVVKGSTTTVVPLTTTQIPEETTTTTTKMNVVDQCPFSHYHQTSPCFNENCLFNSTSTKCLEFIFDYCAVIKDADEGCLFIVKDKIEPTPTAATPTSTQPPTTIISTTQHRPITSTSYAYKAKTTTP